MIQNPFFPEIHGNFGFGCMRLPVIGGNQTNIDFEEPNILVEHALVM